MSWRDGLPPSGRNFDASLASDLGLNGLGNAECREKIAMSWLIANWPKSTIFLAIYTAILLTWYLMPTDFALYLIWIQVPVYFLHQFEEYVFPGGFMAFFNTRVLGSDRPDFPLDAVASFYINIPIIFVAFPLSALLAGRFGIAIGLWTAYFSVINAASHVGMFFKLGYNPGLFFSVVLNIPVGLYATGYFIVHDTVSWQAHAMSLLIGLGVQGALMVYGFRYLKPKIAPADAHSQL